MVNEWYNEHPFVATEGLRIELKARLRVSDAELSEVKK